MSSNNHEFRIDFQSPPRPLLYNYNRLLPASSQSPDIPPTFLAAIAVRENVFVHDLGVVPLEHHLDADDARSCHWVLYDRPRDSNGLTLEPNPTAKVQDALPDHKKEEKVQNETYEQNGNPIGTIRLIPFPHHSPHPISGARLNPSLRQLTTPPLPASEVFFTPTPAYAPDRVTSFHDGFEPYVRIGRLSVLKEWRGKGCASMMIQEALKWISENPWFANQCNADDPLVQGRQWNGLVCALAQENAFSTWKRNGFEIDERMGYWWDFGVRQAGMWVRVDVKGGREKRGQ